MKTQFYKTIGFSVIIAGLCIGGFLIFQNYVSRSGPSINPNNQNVNTSQLVDMQLFFGSSNQASTRLIAYNLKDNNSKEIQTFKANPSLGLPLFDKYDDGHFFGYQLENESGILLSSQGEKVNYDGPDLQYNSFLLSPSGKNLFYSLYSASRESFEYFIKTADGVTHQIDVAGKPKDIVGESLHAIAWSTDEMRIWLDRSVPTAGYFPGLFYIDLGDFKLHELPIIKQNNIVLVTIDNFGFAYGIDNNQINFKGTSGPKEIIKIDLNSNTITRLPVSHMIRKIFPVQPSGSFLMYIDTNSNLYLYNLVTSQETLINSYTEIRNISWHDNLVSFSATFPDYKLGIILVDTSDMSKQTINEIDSLGSYLSVIGWFSKE
ncbi:MAG: hypothetical protein V1668_02750 [Patescibacteria group bacterium]